MMVIFATFSLAALRNYLLPRLLFGGVRVALA